MLAAEGDDVTSPTGSAAPSAGALGGSVAGSLPGTATAAAASAGAADLLDLLGELLLEGRLDGGQAREGLRGGLVHGQAACWICLGRAGWSRLKKRVPGAGSACLQALTLLFPPLLPLRQTSAIPPPRLPTAQ